jgi:DNA topoisomerase-1
MKFTAAVEHELDEVETGNKHWVPVIDSFFKPFQKEVEKAVTSLE